MKKFLSMTTGIPWFRGGFKTLGLTLGLVCMSFISLACPVCEKQQPSYLKGIAHGAGPQNEWDLYIFWSMVVIVLACLIFSIKWLIKPGEKNPNHIKAKILNLE